MCKFFHKTDYIFINGFTNTWFYHIFDANFKATRTRFNNLFIK